MSPTCFSCAHSYIDSETKELGCRKSKECSRTNRCSKYESFFTALNNKIIQQMDEWVHHDSTKYDNFAY
jgi:hypothetical protein